MASPPPDGGEQGPGGPAGDDSQLLPGWSSLVILLTLFGVISVVTMLAILRSGEEVHVTPDAGGVVAYGPADFPEIGFDAPLLPAVAEAGPTGDTSAFNVPPPPFTDGIYPCSGCHEGMEPDLTHRELGFHDEIQIQHGPSDRWCFDCHNADDRDHLRLANGSLVGFDESYKLCGQCHGTIYRDWREGIHGRRRGYWSGAKSYMLCAHCHNPHAPAFQPMEPLPPPIRPSFLGRAHEPEAGATGHASEEPHS
jgi:hypothetical protein